MGKQKQTQTTEIGPESQQAQQLFNLFTSLAQDADEQLGDLSGLAQGQLPALDPGIREALREQYELALEQSRVGIEDNLSILQNQLGEQLSARGMQGSTIEAVSRALLQRQGLQDLNRAALQGQGQFQGALAQMPLAIAGRQLEANQALLHRLTGLGGSTLQGRLNQQLAQTRTTATQSGGQWGQMSNAGLKIGSVIPGPHQPAFLAAQGYQQG